MGLLAGVEAVVEKVQNQKLNEKRKLLPRRYLKRVNENLGAVVAVAAQAVAEVARPR